MLALSWERRQWPSQYDSHPSRTESSASASRQSIVRPYFCRTLATNQRRLVGQPFRVVVCDPLMPVDIRSREREVQQAGREPLPREGVGGAGAAVVGLGARHDALDVATVCEHAARVRAIVDATHLGDDARLYRLGAGISRTSPTSNITAYSLKTRQLFPIGRNLFGTDCPLGFPNGGTFTDQALSDRASVERQLTPLPGPGYWLLPSCYNNAARQYFSLPTGVPCIPS